MIYLFLTKYLLSSNQLLPIYSFSISFGSISSKNVFLVHRFVQPQNNIKFRYITIFSEQYHKRTVFSVDKGDLGEESVDLRTLRALRVLRPLKLVSGIPSKKMTVGV